MFKVLAVLWVFGGVYAASRLSQAGLASYYQLAAVAGGIVLGCWSAFFGYVLSLLRDVARKDR